MFRHRSLADTSRPIRCLRAALSATLVLALTVVGMPVVPAAQETPTEQRWPRELETTTGGKIVVYQPQVDAWNDYTQLHGLMAMSYASTADASPEVGTARFVADTDTDLESGLVRVHSLVLEDVKFPALSEDESAALAPELKRHADGSELVVELDRLVADLDRAQTPVRQLVINTEPPAIFYSDTPAILVQFDGEPVISPIEGSDVKYVLNTNWDVLQEPGTERWYLRVSSYWLSSRELSGPWSPRPGPDAFRELPSDDNWAEVRSNIPGPFVGTQVPPVFVSETPAEVILTEGLPALSPIPNSRLLMVTNTESDLFLSRDDGKFYFLVSGRWFSTDDLSSGEWTFATSDLPGSFAAIPEDHAAAHVLASVPGTPQSEEAVILAQIPETAQVDRMGVEAPPVEYQGGEPQFESIPGTSVSRAVNTTNDIVKVGDLYYLCFQGVWFRSAQPTGPWEVADEVPDPVYTIPADSPSHHVTYVTVEDSSPDWVTFAVFGGYMGMMYAWGCCMVWGTGWYYPPYVYYGGFYPMYYPYPYSYGAGAWYNPAVGRYGRGVSGYGPYGGFGYGSAYNPRTGTYARGGAAYGPYGAGRYAEAFNPRTGTSAAIRQGTNYYGAWSTAGVRQGNDWARTARVANADGARAAGLATSTGRRGFVGTDGDNNLYAGRDGNVYRRNEGGGWQQYGNGNWSDVSGERVGQAQQRVEQAGGRAGVADAARQRAGTAGQNRTGDAARQRAGTAGQNRTGDAARQRAGSSGRTRTTIGDLDRDARSRSRGTSRVQRRGSGGLGGGRAGGGRRGGGRRR
jgi:hypothetical protein